MDWSPIILTLQLSSVTTFLLLIIGIPISYWLSNTKIAIKPIIETIVSLPLVLPPTVLGFYLLVFLSPSNSFGAWIEDVFGLRLLFSFEGLVFASVIYSLPFMIQPIQAGFASLPQNLKEASYLLGKGKWETIFKVLLPNIKPALLTGIVLSFAHTIGEFGVVLMIGGNISGETKVASIAVYDEVEALNYNSANKYSLILLAITFSILFTVYLVNSGTLKKRYK